MTTLPPWQEIAQTLLLTTAYHYTPERGVIVLAWAAGIFGLIGLSPWIAAKWSQ